jgi:hypothetical protein
MTLRFPAPAGAATTSSVVALTSESPNGPWVPLVTRRVGSDLEVQVTHLSWFSFVFGGLDAVAHQLRTLLLDGISGGLTAEADAPGCSDHSGFAEDYAVASSGSALLWCTGLESGRPVVTVTNDRRYPVDVSHPELTVVHNQPTSAELEQLARFASGQSTVLLPRASITYGVSEGGGELQTGEDTYAENLYALQTGVDALFTILSEGGFTELHGSQAAIKAVLDVRGCASALGGTPGDLIADCFGPKDILDAFGPKAFVVAAVVALGEVPNYFRSAFNAIGDALDGRDRFTMTIQPSTSSPETPPTPVTATTPTEQSADTTPTCAEYESMSPDQQASAIAAMQQAHGDTSPAEEAALSVSFFCRVYPTYQIDGIYNGNL